MRVTIEINCDNAAFEDSAGAEVARILREAADTCCMTDLNEPYNRFTVKLRDLNGNTVGRFEVGE